MENEKKIKDSSNKNLYLIAFIIIAILGLALVITGFILDKTGRDAFNALEHAKGEKYQTAWYIYLLDISGALVFLLSFSYLYHFFHFFTSHIKSATTEAAAQKTQTPIVAKLV